MEKQPDLDIYHTLVHMNIAPDFVEATVVRTLATPERIDSFFETLRNGHRNAFVEHEPSLAQVIGHREEDDLRIEYGPPGVFVGKMAITKSGLITIENVLHPPEEDHKYENPELDVAMKESITAARQALTGSNR